jgi:3-methyladenine DNA glycosylase AlkD
MHSQRFFRTGPGEYGEGDRFLGIRVPRLRELAREFRGAPERVVKALLESPFHEERLLALLILVDRCRRSDDDERGRIYDLYLDHLGYVNNWDLVDCSAPEIVGRHLRVAGITQLYELADSDDLWARRIAVMATFALIRQNAFEHTFALAERLIDDREDLIHKAVGWMLREIGNRDRAALERFLRKHYRTMPRTMLRYAIEKLPEPRRTAYLTGAVR